MSKTPKLHASSQSPDVGLPRWHRADDLAAALRCPRSTIYWLHAVGRLKGVKIGRMLRFRPEDVQAFLDSEAGLKNASSIESLKPPDARM
jgi:excisionase family DNA binding protein